MKKRLIVFCILISFSLIIDVSSNYEDDYTLIDCINGNDETGESFNSILPYLTLKGGIEDTINYINSDINIEGNEETASGKIFNIKVKCSTSNILDSIINLGFKGTDYNNELLIEGIGDNGLIIQKTKFKILKGGGGVVFQNAKFLNEYNDYFEDQIFNSNYMTHIHPSSKGVTIKNSYIKLNNNINLGSNSLYYYKSCNMSYCYSYKTNYANKQKIINSEIEIELTGDYNFKMPFYLKDSKILFRSKESLVEENDGELDGPGGMLEEEEEEVEEENNPPKYNISFNEEGFSHNYPYIDYSVFISNEIDLGNNNLNIENDSDISFINNKFSNFNDLNLGGGALFFNNTFENNSDINISSSKFLLNNIFKSTFSDTYDVYNLRKNYGNNEVGEKGIGWIFKRKNDLNFFDIDISSKSLYKEILGIDIENLYDSIYVIFSK